MLVAIAIIAIIIIAIAIVSKVNEVPETQPFFGWLWSCMLNVGFQKPAHKTKP